MTPEKQIEEIVDTIDAYIENVDVKHWYRDELDEGLAEAIYDAGYRKQEWISIEERLPEKGGIYLVHYHDDIIGEYVITREYWEQARKFAPMDYYEKHTGRKALHWMPLPEAPKNVCS